MIDTKKLDEAMLELGFPENQLGTEYVRLGAALYDRSMSMMADLYPAIAKAAETTASRVERAMRHSIETAWNRGDWESQRKYFGSTVSPQKGKPTNGEFFAMMARRCRAD